MGFSEGSMVVKWFVLSAHRKRESGTVWVLSFHSPDMCTLGSTLKTPLHMCECEISDSDLFTKWLYSHPTSIYLDFLQTVCLNDNCRDWYTLQGWHWPHHVHTYMFWHECVVNEYLRGGKLLQCFGQVTEVWGHHQSEYGLATCSSVFAWWVIGLFVAGKHPDLASMSHLATTPV